MTTVNESNSPDSSIQSSSDVDHDATSNRDHDGDVLTPESVQTEELSVNSLFNPLKASSWYVDYWPISIDNLDTATFGSGAVGVGSSEGSYIVRTGSTADSEADLWQEINPHDNPPSWDADRYARFTCGVTDLSGRGIVGTGFANPGSLSNRSLGFRFEVGDILAFAADGASVQTATAVSGTSTGQHDCYIKYTAGTECEFWVDSDPATDAPDATITSNLPSGTTLANYAWVIGAENPDGVNFDVEIYHAEVVQA